MKRQIHKANRHIKRYSASLAIREVQIKTVISYYYIPIKMAEMENSTVTNVGEDMEKLNHLYVAGGIIKWYSHCRKCLSVFWKTKHETSYNIIQFSNYTPGSYPRYKKTYIHTETCIHQYF